VGTQPEMERFQAAFKRVMDGTSVGAIRPVPRRGKRQIDGFIVPS